MGRIARQLRRRKRVLLVWSFLLVLVLGRAAYVACSSRYGEVRCIGFLTARNALLLLAVLAIPPLLYSVLAFLRERKASRAPGFRNHPWDYDKQVVELAARVEVILADRMFEKTKRHLTDVYRTATGNDDFRGRYVHQRILVSSPALKRGELVLVLHNVNYGKLSLSEGRWLRIRGEYLHTPAPKRGRKTFYGQIHFTHEPKGRIEILEGKPADAAEVVAGNPTGGAGARIRS